MNLPTSPKKSRPTYWPTGWSALSANPTRYEYHLTERGADLLPVLQHLALWSKRHIEDRWSLPDWFARGTPEQFYPKGQAGENLRG